MIVDFQNLAEQVIPMENFRMKWRFTDKDYDLLPDAHLAQLKPLNAAGANFLWDYIIQTQLHRDAPFKKDFFNTIDKALTTDSNQQEIKKWLYQRGIPFGKQVYLSWQPDNAMIVPWKILIKYYDTFYYPVADDLTVFDESLRWALLFFHEHEVYFGTNEKFYPANIHQELDFLY